MRSSLRPWLVLCVSLSAISAVPVAQAQRGRAAQRSSQHPAPATRQHLQDAHARSALEQGLRRAIEQSEAAPGAGAPWLSRHRQLVEAVRNDGTASGDPGAAALRHLDRMLEISEARPAIAEVALLARQHRQDPTLQRVEEALRQLPAGSEPAQKSTATALRATVLTYLGDVQQATQGLTRPMKRERWTAIMDRARQSFAEHLEQDLGLALSDARAATATLEKIADPLLEVMKRLVAPQGVRETLKAAPRALQLGEHRKGLRRELQRMKVDPGLEQELGGVDPARLITSLRTDPAWQALFQAVLRDLESALRSSRRGR